MATDNNKHRLFAQEYCRNGFRAREAYRLVYGNVKAAAADSAASRMLKNVKVNKIVEGYKKRLGAKLRTAADRLGISEETVLRHLDEIRARCMESKELRRWDPKQQEYVSMINKDGDIVFSFDSAGANKALEHMGKHLKMFTERQEVTSTLKGKFIINIVKRKERDD